MLKPSLSFGDIKMPPGDPIANIFAIAFQQTTGLTLDIWTVATAGVVILFVMIGFTKVTEALGTVAGNAATDSDLKSVKLYKQKERDATNQNDDVMASFYRSKSRNAVSRAARR